MPGAPIRFAFLLPYSCRFSFLSVRFRRVGRNDSRHGWTMNIKFENDNSTGDHSNHVYAHLHELAGSLLLPRPSSPPASESEAIDPQRARVPGAARAAGDV